MPDIGQLFANNLAGLTVYSPDATHSQLIGHLDQHIHDRTSFVPVFRRWINHDYNSVMRFYTEPGKPVPTTDDPLAAVHRYNTMPPESIQYGHLVVRLLLNGPALLTIWQGEDAIDTLMAVKGTTQPATAAPDSVRGGFWCDNGVCNLMHSSDSTDEARRELEAMGLSDALDRDPTPHPLIPAIESPSIAHSGLLTVIEVIRRVCVTTTACEVPSVQLPISGGAVETHTYLTDIIQKIKAQSPSDQISQWISDYLAGDMVAVTTAMGQLPVTPWEKFVIQCGVVNRADWT